MCATKKQKSTALLFSSLSTGICEVSRVKFEASDERVKNEETIIAWIVEMIVVESTTAATPKQSAATKRGQATWIEKILYELSEILNACVQAQREDNQRFWTYCILKHININLLCI